MNKYKKICLDLVDYPYKRRVVFYEETRKKKAKIHAVLDDLTPNGFVYKNIPLAITKPDSIYQDLTNKDRRNYYRIDSYNNVRNGRIYFYTKVIVAKFYNIGIIITAYDPQFIKEENNSSLCLYQKK